MVHSLSVWELFTAWSAMAIFMMGPISLLSSLRKRLNFIQIVFSLVGFLNIWVASSVVVFVFYQLLGSFNHTLVTVCLWAFAGAYQFSSIHNRYLSRCGSILRSSSYQQGLVLGRNCLIVCGPLMVAAFWALPGGTAAMAVLTILMISEVMSKYQKFLSFFLGLVSAVVASGVLFLSGPLMDLGQIPMHVHH